MAEENSATPPAGGQSAPDFNKIEQDILKFWDEHKTFEKSLEQTKDGEPYVFYDGPPFATGLPHYGSILPSVIKDAIPRYQTMKGHYVRRRWGWDCHGLPIENLVEKNLKISGKKQIEELGVERFNKVCRDNVMNLAHEWGKMVRRIARWTEFENSYKTMDTSYMESVWSGLQQTWEKGLIYEDRKVLLYCSRCETPISNFEVAMDNSYRDVTEESVYVKFKMLKGQRIINDLTNDRTYALAWTTTPWTLPGNTALNIGPDIAYVIVDHESGERYIVAKDRLSVVGGDYEIVAEVAARALEGLQYEPLYPAFAEAVASMPDMLPDQASRMHRIYSASFVTTTDGTGIVHNAAMYGEEDYQLAKEKNLPRVDMLDHKGQYLPIAPENLRGVFFKDADKIVLKELSEKNLVYKTENFTHSYPHCYRCGTPLFYNALPAWFINIQKVKQDLIANNQSINWYPEHLKFGRFQLGIENAPDWNISRNRYWATALPFWKCSNQECRHVTCIGSVRELVEESLNFAEVYPDFEFLISNFKSNPDYTPKHEEIQKLDLHKPFIDYVKLKCEKCTAVMNRIPEVVDCWVESGSMPFAELHAPFENVELFKKRFPSDFVVEYIPQTRAWFYVMHVVSTILFGRAPFKNVMTTGTILGEDGTKMSKSKGNYPDPNIIIEKYGADALRFYLLSSPVVTGEDVNFSEKGVQEVSRKLNMILYNVWSFYRMFEKQQISVSADELISQLAGMHVLDRWILSKTSKLHQEVTAQMDSYNTVRATRAIVEFVNDFSTWYVRRSRERMRDNTQESGQALRVFGFVLAETAKILAPFTPFLSEFLYRDITGQESVHLAPWSQGLSGFANDELEKTMEIVRGIVELGLSLRKEHNLKVRQPLAGLRLQLKDAGMSLTEDLLAILAEELNVKAVEVAGEAGGLPQWVSKESQFGKVAINTELTPELRLEGTARELERTIQDLRKKSGLKVGELVDVYYNTQDDQLEEVLLNQFDRKKTFVSQIQKSLEVEADFEIQAVVEGKAIWIGMIRI